VVLLGVRQVLLGVLPGGVAEDTEVSAGCCRRCWRAPGCCWVLLGVAQAPCCRMCCCWVLLEARCCLGCCLGDAGGTLGVVGAVLGLLLVEWWLWGGAAIALLVAWAVDALFDHSQGPSSRGYGQGSQGPSGAFESLPESFRQSAPPTYRAVLTALKDQFKVDMGMEFVYDVCPVCRTLYRCNWKDSKTCGACNGERYDKDGKSLCGKFVYRCFSETIRRIFSNKTLAKLAVHHKYNRGRLWRYM
jgi:hypothetical protein